MYQACGIDCEIVPAQFPLFSHNFGPMASALCRFIGTGGSDRRIDKPGQDMLHRLSLSQYPLASKGISFCHSFINGQARQKMFHNKKAIFVCNFAQKLR
jgi:hypothetical protein